MRVQICLTCGAIMPLNAKKCSECHSDTLTKANRVSKGVESTNNAQKKNNNRNRTDFEDKIVHIIKKELKNEVLEIDKLKKYKEYMTLGMEFFDGLLERLKEVAGELKGKKEEATPMRITDLSLQERLRLLRGQNINVAPTPRPQIVNRVPKTAGKEEVEIENVEESKENEEVTEILEKDIQEKIGLVITFIKNMDDEEFRNKIEKKEELIGHYKGLLKFLPAQYRGIILSLDMTQIKETLKTETPSKYEILEELQGWGHLENQFNELKKILRG